MATNFQYDYKLGNLTLSGSAITSQVDESGNGYTLTGNGTGGGPTYVARGFNGWDCAQFNGTDHYQNNDAGAATFLSGNDSIGFMMAAVRFLGAGTSGDILFGYGNSGTANPFIRVAEGTTSSWTSTKRDDATSAGGGAGFSNVGTIPSTRQILEWTRDATNVSAINWTATQAPTSISSTASDVGTTTVNRFAIGALARTTVASFGNWEVAYVWGSTTIPTGNTLDQLRTFFSRFVKPSMQPMMMRGREEHCPTLGHPIVRRVFFGVPCALKGPENRMGL